MERSLIQLCCLGCEQVELLDEAQTLARLQGIGMLRREKEPSPELLVELLSSAAARLRCSSCGNLGLSTQSPADENPWDAMRTCGQCRKTISAARLAVFPEATLCADCQGARDQGETGDEPEFCPRCGALMKLQLSRQGGLTRYISKCTECRF